MDATQVYGWWSLISWRQEYDDGRVICPFGDNPEGRLIYSPGGEFSVMISKPDRPRFTTGGQWNAAAAEKAAAYDGMLAYHGVFTVTGDEMSHVVAASLFPNWKGSIQRRKIKLQGDELTLSGRLEENSNEARSVVLRWRKAKA